MGAVHSIKDVADLSWEIPRLRRYRALMIERRREFDASIEYAREHADDPRLDTEAESARLLIYYLPQYETIDKLLTSAELRRDRILANWTSAASALRHFSVKSRMS